MREKCVRPVESEKGKTNLVRKLVEHSANIDIVAEYRVTSIHAVSTFLLAAWNEASMSEKSFPRTNIRNKIFA